MARIAITDGLANNAVQSLVNAGHEVVLGSIDTPALKAGELAKFDAIIIRSATKLTKQVISNSTNGRLKVIGRAGVGVDNIDLQAATTAGIQVVNAPGASTQSVAEMTLAHLLASARRITEADRTLRAGEWAKQRLKGCELSSKNLGLFGYGRIARAVANRARAFGMRIHAFDPYLPEKVFPDDVERHQSLSSLFTHCTHISIHCNLSPETKHAVNQELLGLMPGVAEDGVECGNHLINCARGGIVDEKAVFSALEDGTLRSAALDVFESEPVDTDHPLLQHPGFHGTPHIGASTLEAQSRVGLEIVEMVLCVLTGSRPATLVNPDVLADD